MLPDFEVSPIMLSVIAVWETLYEYQTNYTCWRDENSKADMRRIFGVIPDETDHGSQRRTILRSKYASEFQDHDNLIYKMLDFREDLQELNDDIV